MAWGRYTREFSLLDTQTFTSSTTYTLPTNYKFIRYACIGAGGGGGGATSFFFPAVQYQNSNMYYYTGGSGGSGGAYQEGFWRVPIGLATISIVVGAGGACNTAGGYSAIGNLILSGAGNGTTSVYNNDPYVAGTQTTTLASTYSNAQGAGSGISADGSITFENLAGRRSYLGGGGGGNGYAIHSSGSPTYVSQAGGSSHTVRTDAFPSIGSTSANRGGGGAAGGTNTAGSPGATGSAGSATAAGYGTGGAGGGGGGNGNSGTAGTAGGGGGFPGGGGGGAGPRNIPASSTNYYVNLGGTGGNAVLTIEVFG